MASTRFGISIGIVIGLSSVLASPLPAQEPEPPEEKPLLSGPEVRENRAPGGNRPMMDDRESPRPRVPVMARLARHRGFLGAVMGLNAQAPDELRLQPEQQAEIRRIVREFNRQLRAARPDDARRTDRPRGTPRDRQTDQAPDGERDPRRPRIRHDAERAEPGKRDQGVPRRREAIEHLRRNAPDPAPYHNRIWAVLTEPQQDWVRTRLEQLQVEWQAGRDGMLAEGREGDAARANPDAPGPFAREMPASLRERLEAMSPARRAELWRRLDRFLEARERDRPAGEPRRRLGVEDVDIPDPR